APAYRGDGIDWYDVDVDLAAAAPAAAGSGTGFQVHAVPTPVSYGGMPAPRFWQMEDAASDLGAVEAAAHDVGRLLLVEFATVYGNDWFVLPIRVSSGTLTSIGDLVVSDVFGRNFLVTRAGINEPQWNLFPLST